MHPVDSIADDGHIKVDSATEDNQLKVGIQRMVLLLIAPKRKWNYTILAFGL